MNKLRKLALLFALLSSVTLGASQKANAMIKVDGYYCGPGLFEIFDQWGNMVGCGVDGGPFDGGGGGGGSGGGNSGGGGGGGGSGNYDGVEDILPARLNCLVSRYHMPGYGPIHPIKKKLSWAYNSGPGTPIHQYWSEQIPPPTLWSSIVRGVTSGQVSYLFNRAFKPLNGNVEGEFFGVENNSGSLSAEEAALFTALHEAGHQNGLGEPGANYMGIYGVQRYRVENDGSACQ